MIEAHRKGTGTTWMCHQTWSSLSIKTDDQIGYHQNSRKSMRPHWYTYNWINTSKLTRISIKNVAEMKKAKPPLGLHCDADLKPRQKQGLQASHPVLDNCGERASLYWRMWQLLPLPSDLRLTSLQYMLKPWSPRRLSWDWAVSKLPNLILVRIHWLNPDWGTLTSNQSDMCKNVCVIKTQKE